MECVKNSEIVKLLFKLKNIEKIIASTSQHLRGIKAAKGSWETYGRCLNLYHEGCSYFFQICGFVKSQYFNETSASSGTMFLINNLYTPSYKTFLILRQTLANIQVDDIYSDSLKLLTEKVDTITGLLSELQSELREI